MRVLPQRHDHHDEGAADAHAASAESRGARGVAIQSVPVRRAYRNCARGAAGCRPRYRGTRLMAAPQGTLTVVRPAASGASETFIKITADGSVTAFNGHVDLGTGIRTALGQIVAEELDVSFA